MQRVLIFLFVFGLALFVAAKGDAQIIFFADFEDNSVAAFPDQGSNDLANWVPENPDQIWDLAPFPNGTQGLLNTVEGCGASGNTPVFGVDNFSDGIIQFEMSWGDDDSWGIVLRSTAADRGYLVVFGYIETPAVIVALMDEGCAEVGTCLDQTACENNPDTTLIQEAHTLGAVGDLSQDNTVPYLGRIEAIGDTIRVWYVPLADVNPASPNLGDPLVEIQDGTHASGSVGVWHESQGNCMVDNVLVSGPTFQTTAVDFFGKMATKWGTLKEQY